MKTPTPSPAARPLNIAFVKQDVYQDLYVGPSQATADELLFSSIMRVGPIGLFTRLNAVFFIVKEDAAPECAAWKVNLPSYQPSWFRELQHKPITQTGFPEARFLQPGSDRNHGEFAVEAGSVDWSAFDVVISINLAIPARIVALHSDVLWCYMSGEATPALDQFARDYDVCLNQETRGIISSRTGVVDFPYTFVGPDCLERILESKLHRPPERRGIYLEINSIPERPVLSVPEHLKPLERSGHPLRLHRQNIRANLEALYDSKYFVKVGGRNIRGNSIIEAISCGVIVIMNPSKVHHSQLLPPESWAHSLEETLALIEHLEKNPQACAALQQAQRERLRHYVFEAPLDSIRNALEFKRLQSRSSPRSRLRCVLSGIKRRLKRG